MENSNLYVIVNECLAIGEFDRTPEQQVIVELYTTIVSSYENVTGEKWKDNV